jgi:uncharacterized protein (DUF4415 family)
MTGNKKSTASAWSDPDDAPDLSTPDWRRKLDKAPVKRGRPKLAKPKISTTIRLDADVLSAFREKGPRWQSRINTALREWLDKKTG